MSLVTFLFVGTFSSAAFCWYYVTPTYEQWRYKINRNYPSADRVRSEVLQSMKGVAFSALAPACALYLSQRGLSQSYCGVGDLGWCYLIGSSFCVWLASDIFQTAEHYLGHTLTSMWSVHKHHHRFYNPTPFAVLTDDPMEHLLHTAPMVLFAWAIPVNLDVLFFIYGGLLLPWGVYHHLGHEFERLDAHHKWLNTSYQHYLHHALAVIHKPYHCGYFLKSWDQLLGSEYSCEICGCSKCARARGDRSLEQWELIEKPDYSSLLKLSFWMWGSTPSSPTTAIPPPHRGYDTATNSNKKEFTVRRTANSFRYGGA